MPETKIAAIQREADQASLVGVIISCTREIRDQQFDQWSPTQTGRKPPPRAAPSNQTTKTMSWPLGEAEGRGGR